MITDQFLTLEADNWYIGIIYTLINICVHTLPSCFVTCTWRGSTSGNDSEFIGYNLSAWFYYWSDTYNIKNDNLSADTDMGNNTFKCIYYRDA